MDQAFCDLTKKLRPGHLNYLVFTIFQHLGGLENIDTYFTFKGTVDPILTTLRLRKESIQIISRPQTHLKMIYYGSKLFAELADGINVPLDQVFDPKTFGIY